MDTNSEDYHREESRTATYIGYDLGFRVAEEILPVDSDDRAARIFDCLEKIARGETTLLSSGAEMRLLFPDVPDIEERRRRNQQALQAAANVVLDKYLSMTDQ